MENKLGKFLREKRGETSLRDFAKKLDISHTYLDSLEKGYDSRNKKPLRVTVDTLSKIAKALDEPLNKLVAYSENKDYLPEKIDENKINVAFSSGFDGLNETNKNIIQGTIEGLLAKQKLDEDKKEK